MRFNVISVSGGKDSLATWLLALEREPRESIRPVFADTGNEHELTYEYLTYLEGALDMPIVRLRRSFAEEIAARRMFVARDQRVGRRNGRLVRHTNKAKRRILAALRPTGNPYLDLCLWKGRFPARKMQFCTQFLKTEPLVEYQLGLIDQGNEVWSWQGMRAEESPNRANLAEHEEVGGGLWNHRPIHKLTAEQVFAIAARHGIKPNPLYTMGMSRVGCMPCINAAKAEVLEISSRFPDHIERINSWEESVGQCSKRNQASFFPDPDRDAHLNKRGIYNVVEWSKTTRGGRQFNLLTAANEPGHCSSSYGLCE